MMILTGEEYGRVQLMKNDRQNMLVSSSEGKGQYTHVSESQFFDLERTVGKILSDYRIPVETTAWIEKEISPEVSFEADLTTGINLKFKLINKTKTILKITPTESIDR